MSKFGVPLLVTVLATIAFNLLPIALGRGMAMYGAFAFYAGFVFIVGRLDRRALGYAMVLTACNPSGGLAPLSYSLLLALLILVTDSASASLAIRRLAANRWWWLLVLAVGTSLLTVPMWSHDPRVFLTNCKDFASRLGYLIVFALAAYVTINNSHDAMRVASLACVSAVTTVAAFFFLGDKGVPEEYVWNVGVFSYDSYQRIGNAYMAFTRTQICILLAAVAVTSLSIAVSVLPRFLAVVLLGTAALCVYLIMQLASTGSAFAMAVGMGVAGLAYVLSRPSAFRIIASVMVTAALGTALVYAVFNTQNELAKRIELKQRAAGIDRLELWKGAVEKTLATPLGSGWTTEFALRKHAHNDFLVYFLSFGWLGGLFYAAWNLGLGLWFLWWLLRVPHHATYTRAMVIAGLATLTVYGANSMLDMLSASIGNYEMVWGLILLCAVGVAQEQDEPGLQEQAFYAARQGEYGAV